MRPLLLLWILLGGLGCAQLAQAGEGRHAAPESPPRYGLSLLLGSSYDPHQIGLAMVQGQVRQPYAQVFWHPAPESLFLKYEANLGLTTDGRHRLLLAVNMLALKHLDSLATRRGTPYLEAGIGLIYTDFQVDGQGLRFNFNPLAGVGFEYPLTAGRTLTCALRLHHLSNGGFARHNRGVNSALLLFGVLF